MILKINLTLRDMFSFFWSCYCTVYWQYTGKQHGLPRRIFRNLTNFQSLLNHFRYLKSLSRHITKIKTPVKFSHACFPLINFLCLCLCIDFKAAVADRLTASQCACAILTSSRGFPKPPIIKHTPVLDSVLDTWLPLFMVGLSNEQLLKPVFKFNFWKQINCKKN